MTDPCLATELVADFIAGRYRAGDLCREVLAEVKRRDPALKAFRELTPDRALRRAADLDADHAAGRSAGPLAGIPVAVKDNLCTDFGVTAAGSGALAHYRAPYNATVVERIEAAGALIIGKTNMDEFGMGSSNEHSAFFPTRNPWNPDSVPGGSSGGSAAAVAARLVPLALGSDTGGSIRQPAAFCGVVGLKPTYGLVSRYGLIAYGSSFDQIGPIATNVHDAALLLSVIAGHDPRDQTSAEVPRPDYAAALSDDRLADRQANLRVGVPREFFGDGVDDSVRRLVTGALEVLVAQGARVVELSLPLAANCLPAYYLAVTAECSSNLARYDGVHFGHRATRPRDLQSLYSTSRDESFGPEVKRRILLGTFALLHGHYGAYYERALRIRRRVKDEFDAAFQRVDVIVGPTTPTAAFGFGERTEDPLQMLLADVFTCPVNMAGLPAISVPCGFTDDRLPVGMQLIAPAFAETVLLQVAALYQSVTDWHRRLPAG